MKRKEILHFLKEALQRYSFESYQRFTSSDNTHIQEVNGTPSDSPDNDYCHLEVAVLDNWNNGSVEIVHVTITATDGFQNFGGALFFQSDGKVQIGAELCEFIDGVAEPIQES